MPSIITKWVYEYIHMKLEVKSRPTFDNIWSVVGLSNSGIKFYFIYCNAEGELQYGTFGQLNDWENGCSFNSHLIIPGNSLAI